MDNYLCRFCDHYMSLSEGTHFELSTFFRGINNIRNQESCICLHYYKCPFCGEISIVAEGKGKLNGQSFMIHPSTYHKVFPDYVPEQIRADYYEACSIIDLSPKSSATLCRRCLQGMIRDFWGVTDATLYKEIDQIMSLTPPTQWKAIDAIRKLGNIGAHMEKDVNTIIEISSDEAKKLLILIEKLISAWDVERRTEEQLYSEIVTIAESK